MQFLLDLFGERQAAPVLFRVSGPSGPPRSVEVRARWAPSGEIRTKSLLTDEGLCLLPWLRDATAVELQLRAGRARGTVSVDRSQDGAVVHIDLEDRPSAPAL